MGTDELDSFRYLSDAVLSYTRSSDDRFFGNIGIPVFRPGTTTNMNHNEKNAHIEQLIAEVKHLREQAKIAAAVNRVLGIFDKIVPGNPPSELRAMMGGGAEARHDVVRCLEETLEEERREEIFQCQQRRENDIQRRAVASAEERVVEAQRELEELRARVAESQTSASGGGVATKAEEPKN